MEKLIITAAVNGGITSRVKNPNVPYTPEEIAESVYQCWQAGASIAHIHARDSEGKPSYEFCVWKEIVERVRDRCDIVINLSTSGLNLPSCLAPEEAWNHLSLCPEIASFNCGSVNHGAKPFINPPALAKKLAEDINKYNVIPEIEVYHSGVINEAVSLKKEGFIKSPMLFSFAMGIHGGVTAECKNLMNLIDNIPDDSMWSAIGIGRKQLPINIHTILLGGHVRTGLEDNVYYKKGELATGSAQLVERIVRIVRISRELGRDISSPDEARKAMGLNFVRAVA